MATLRFNIHQTQSFSFDFWFKSFCSRVWMYVKSGRTEVWKNWSLEELKSGRTEVWKNRSLEELKSGRSEVWKNWSLEEVDVPRYNNLITYKNSPCTASWLERCLLILRLLLSTINFKKKQFRKSQTTSLN